MNIEESKSLLGWVSLNKLYIDTHNECDYHNIHTAIETLLTAYEEKCKELKKEIQDDLDVRNRWGLTLQELEKEKEKNKEYKNLLIDMVNQFAYEDNNPKTRGSSEQEIYTAGLSTLEDAFYLLNIDEGIKEDLWKLKEE